MLLWILVGVLFVVGLAGLALPIIPGAVLIFGGALLGAWIDNFERVGVGTLTVIGVMGALTFVCDAAGTAFGAKGASVVRTAWKRVGIDVKGASPRQEKSPKLTTAKAKGAVTRAHSRGPERRTRRAS